MTPDLSTAAGQGASKYDRMADGARLRGRRRDEALKLQKMGWTMAEIAKAMGVQVRAVHNTLYWDIAR